MIFFTDLKESFRLWREKRKWKAAHLKWLQTMLQEDQRWLCVDPVASEFVTRYKNAVRDDWYKQNHEPINHFRTRMGMDTTQNALDKLKKAQVK